MKRMSIGRGVVLAICLSITGPAPVRVHAAGPTPLGPIPARCPLGPAPRFIPSLTMDAVGGAPIWAVGFRPNEPLHIGGDYPGLRFPHGWAVKIPWVEHRGYTGLVIIRAWTGPRRQPVWFAGRAQGPLPYLRLDGRRPTLLPPLYDPRHPTRVVPNPAWQGFSSYMYIPRASCYVMEASWPGGAWALHFAAGQ